MGDYYEKLSQQEAIAEELYRRGWELYNYQTREYDQWDEELHGFYWAGIATHPDRPAVILGVHASKFYVEHYSGKMQDESRLPNASGNQVSPYVLRRPPFPVFQATPKGKSWHLETGGKIIKSGVLPNMEHWRHSNPRSDGAIARDQWVDRIEALILGVTTIGSNEPVLNSDTQRQQTRQIRKRIEELLPAEFRLTKVTGHDYRYFNALLACDLTGEARRAESQALFERLKADPALIGVNFGLETILEGNVTDLPGWLDIGSEEDRRALAYSRWYLIDKQAEIVFLKPSFKTMTEAYHARGEIQNSLNRPLHIEKGQKIHWRFKHYHVLVENGEPID